VIESGQPPLTLLYGGRKNEVTKHEEWGTDLKQKAKEKRYRKQMGGLGIMVEKKEQIGVSASWKSFRSYIKAVYHSRKKTIHQGGKRAS